MSKHISPYTRKMLCIELAMKTLLGLCALLVISFLLVLIGYLGFRGLFVRKDIASLVLPDYSPNFTWPAELSSEEPNGTFNEFLDNQAMGLWLSPAPPKLPIDVGKLRGDQLHDILAGKEKNWVSLGKSSERLRVLLTTAQLQNLKRSVARAGIGWRKSRNIQEQPDYAAVAAALLETPGALAILPATWNWEDNGNLANGQDSSKPPRMLSVATNGLLLPASQIASLQKNKAPKPEGERANKKKVSLKLQQAKALLEQGQARTAPYNWLTGQIALPPGYGAVQLSYREYDILKLSFLLRPPAKNGKVGGISTILISTLILICNSLLWAVPLGLAVAVFLVEYTQTAPSKKGSRASSVRSIRLANTVSISIQTLSGIPSIIFGLFGSILFVPWLGIGLLSGSATLVLMLLPTIILTAKEALLTVPRSYIEGSLALGAQKWYTILHISLPSALPGILAGIILAIGRALGETAALIYTLGTGYQAALSRFPQLLRDWPALWQEFWLSPSLARLAQITQDYPLLDLQSSLRSISLHLYWMTINGISLQKGFSTAFVLIFLIVLLNMGARALLTRSAAKHLA